MTQFLKSAPRLSATALLLLSLVNIYFISKRLGSLQAYWNGKQYSYVGMDYPEYLPLDRPLNYVERTFANNTADFPIHGPDAEAAWRGLYADGLGFVRLGPERRILCTSMFHQLHCVEKMRRAFDNPDDPVASIPHLQHCMNYIRQMILCSSDLTLEPEAYNPETGQTEASGVGVTHVCHDWTVVYDTLSNNYARWKSYWEDVKSSVSSP